MSRQPQSEAFDTEIVARHAVEELRGAAYSDGEWAVVRERLLAFARLAEHHYRAKDLATLWSLSPAAIRRLFRDEPGVLRYGRSKKGHQRDYASLRIPASVAERVYRRCLLPDPRQPKQTQ